MCFGDDLILYFLLTVGLPMYKLHTSQLRLLQHECYSEQLQIQWVIIGIYNVSVQLDGFGPKKICISNLLIPIIIIYSKTGNPSLHIHFCGCVFICYSRCFYWVFHSSLQFLQNFCAAQTTVMSHPSRLCNMNAEDCLQACLKELKSWMVTLYAKIFGCCQETSFHRRVLPV